MKRDIEIKIFEDRIELASPGLFPFNITATNIGFVRSEGYRNDLLVKHLREFPEPPNLDQNEGVKAIRSEMRTNNLYPPIYATFPELDDSVRITLLNESVASEWDKVNDYLQKNKFITNEEARNITGIEQSYNMSKLLKKWVESGLLIQIIPPPGYLKLTKYKLAGGKDLQDPK
jgi:ATP-dependent DNA helicase RecG